MYNEEEAIPIFLAELIKVIDATGEEYELVCVNDGSSDNTLAVLIKNKELYPQIRIINLSRNFGKEAALTAGLDMARGDVVIPIDADLQDPPVLIEKMLEKFKEGNDVVLARRKDRSSDSILKRVTAELFYKLFRKLANAELPENVGDFRLMSRRVVDSLKKLRETQRFMKGIFSWPGYQTAVVEYDRQERQAGKTKFSGWKLWNFAVEGITSFSTFPLRIWTYIGSMVALFALSYMLYTIIKTVVFGIDVPGYASLVAIMLFLGGVQLIGIGVIGEYVGRIYLESKRRPIYIVEREI